MSSNSIFAIPAVAALSLGFIGGTTPAYADLDDPLFKLLANDGLIAFEFGFSVANSGVIAIIGSPGDDVNGHASGSAYLFDTTTGLQLFKLLPLDSAEGLEFGWSVAIDGTKAIVGAAQDDIDGNGAAYVFDTTTGQQLFKLVANDGASDDMFGISVAISGTTAIVNRRSAFRVRPEVPWTSLEPPLLAKKRQSRPQFGP